MIIATQPYKDGEIKDPFILQWAQIISGQHIGKWATNEININYFPEIFENLTYEIVELDPSVFQVNTTPPALLPFACIIPKDLQLPFRNGVFKLNGFEVPLDTIGENRVVNMAYFNWLEFRAELDRKYPDGTFVHQGLKDSLMDLWDFVDAHASSIAPWMQDPVNNQLSEFIIYTP